MPPKKQAKLSKDIRGEFLSKAIGHLDAHNKKTNDGGREKDEASVFADSWACAFRKLTPHQQLCAKKAIDDVLILGQLGRLTFNIVNASFDVMPSSSEHESSLNNTVFVDPQIVFDSGYQNVHELLQDPQYN